MMGEGSSATPSERWEKVADRWRDKIQRIEEEQASIHRWILASCLTVNASGILFVNREGVFDNNTVFFSSLWFVVGIISCIL